MNFNWSAISAVATSIAALVTAWMAYMTCRTIQQAHAHHKDEYRPVLILTPYGGIDPPNRNTLLKIIQDSNKNTLQLQCALKNVGAGPSIFIKIAVRAMGVDGYGFEREISPMQAGDICGKPDEPLQIPAITYPRFNERDFQVMTELSWEIIIEYRDVFENIFHTIHAKDISQPWTKLGEGKAPKGRTTPTTDYP